MIKSREELKTYFETGDIPTEEQFADLIDTMVIPEELEGHVVDTTHIADGAVTFHKLAEDAKGVIIPYGTSADIVEGYLETYRNTQHGRLGLYVADSVLGNVPAINSEGNIIRAVSIVKSPEHDEYVDVFILVFDGFEWRRQTYRQVGRVPADGSVTTPKIADRAVTGAKINDGAVGTAKLAARSVTTEKIKEGAVTSTELADGSVTTAILGTDVQNSIAPLTDDEIDTIWNNA